MKGISFIFSLLVLGQFLDVALSGPPQFEQNLQFSDSYLPATMQVIAYLTESMKYDLRPSSGPTTTTTARPTPPHRPGIVQPIMPPPHRIFKSIPIKEQEKSLSEIIRHFEPFLPAGIYEQDLELLGNGAKNLHRAIDHLEDSFKLEDFLEKFDDDATNSNLLFQLKQKKMPPTRAYVTLLSLYDLLNKETKRLALNRFNGNSERVLKDLANISTGTSSFQLEYLLQKVQQQKETRDQMLDNKIKQVLQDLAAQDSYINMALRYIPPLAFTK